MFTMDCDFFTYFFTFIIYVKSHVYFEDLISSLRVRELNADLLHPRHIGSSSFFSYFDEYLL